MVGMPIAAHLLGPPLLIRLLDDLLGKVGRS